MANYFTAAFAEVATPIVDFSPGSDNRLQMQFVLMQADLAARQDNINVNGGTGELDFEATNNIHQSALSTIGLGPEAFALYTPLTILAEHDPSKAQTYFEAAIDSSGFLDTVSDGLLLGFGADKCYREVLAMIDEIERVQNDPVNRWTAGTLKIELEHKLMELDLLKAQHDLGAVTADHRMSIDPSHMIYSNLRTFLSKNPL